MVECLLRHRSRLVELGSKLERSHRVATGCQWLYCVSCRSHGQDRADLQVDGVEKVGQCTNERYLVKSKSKEL